MGSEERGPGEEYPTWAVRICEAEDRRAGCMTKGSPSTRQNSWFKRRGSASRRVSPHERVK